MSTETEVSLEVRQRIELGCLRQNMVESVVRRKVDRCGGEVSNEQIEAWERDAYRRWRETYPSLSMVFSSVVGADQ